MKRLSRNSPDNKGLRKKMLFSTLLVVFGVVIAFPLFSITYYTMVRTSTPQFCGLCHEIQFAVNTWKTSTHVNNAHGVVADCMDCHLPAPHDTFNFFFFKTFHGAKDVFVHFIQDQYDHEKNRQKAYDSFKNEQCQKCHRNILYIPNKRGAMLAHRSVVYAKPGNEKNCVDCHSNLVHNKAEMFRYKQYQNSYRGLGP